MRAIFLLCLCCLLSGQCCFAQNEGYTGAVSPVNPVTPAEAAMFKPVAQPIGSFTGTTPIDIALISGGKPAIPVPITLSYNCSGLKVEELASSVGLGWNLSMGGSITRVMNGLPDDQPSGYLKDTFKPSHLQYLLQIESDSVIPELSLARTGSLDLQPDEFYFSCNGLSGRFHFDELGKVQVEDQNGITIVPYWVSSGQNSVIGGWTLTDTRGNTYYFGTNKAHSLTAVDNNGVTFTSQNGYTNLPPAQTYNADWHLMEIDDMNQENKITFLYSSPQTGNLETRMQAYTKMQTGGTSQCIQTDFNTDETFAALAAHEHYLTQINTPADTIKLYLSARVDYFGGLRVDSIKQYDLFGNLKKMIHLNYDYFLSPNLIGLPPGSGYDQNLKRLELLSVSEFGTSPTDSLTHRFDYYTTYNLPYHMSRGQDYWGYYNGYDNNWTLLPNGSYTFGGQTITEGNYSDRRSVWPYSQADMLTTIHFPTGGTRTFTYEPNQTLLEVGSQIVPDPGYFIPRNLDTSGFGLTPTGNIVRYKKNFRINSQTGMTTFSYNITACCYFGSYTVTIMDSAGYTTYATFSNSLANSYALSNGSYQVRLAFDPTSTDITGFHANWQELVIDTDTLYRAGHEYYKDNITVGGVRVKQVDDYDPVSAQTITTHYQYSLFSDSALTSGLLISSPWVATQFGCGDMDCYYIRLNSNSNYPLNAQAGAYVCYTNVRTYKTGNGRSDRVYSFNFDGAQGDSPSDFPYFSMNNDWQRGKLLSTSYYDNNNNLIQKDSAVYPYINNGGFYYAGGSNDSSFMKDVIFQQSLGYKVAAWLDTQTPSDIVGLLDYCTYPYYITSQFIAPLTQLSYIYTPAGTQVTRTDYHYYDSLRRPFLKQSTAYLNNNTFQLTNYRYGFNSSGDFLLPMSGGDLTMATTLLGLNYLQPLEVTSQKLSGSTTTFDQGTHYGFGSFNGFKYHPNLARHYTTAGQYRDINYVAYDSSGNLTELYKTGDPHTVWIWGYGHNMPVAQVTGSTYATVNALMNYGNLQWPASDVVLRTEVDKVRSTLSSSGVQVVTYSYSPLFGITSKVDPAGMTSYYEYDAHGRLITIRDLHSNIIKKFTYTTNNP